MEIIKTAIPCVLEIQPNVFRDRRGSFVKTFHQELFAEAAPGMTIAEQYYSVSEANVIRGLHFQLPPADHAKLVYCLTGSVLEVAVDLRVGSPTYGDNVTFELSAERGNLGFLPKGFAHGFCVLEGPATMVYNVSSVYSPENDAGLRWDSAGISWPVSNPIMSERDASLPPLAEFDSPFRFRQP
jgi:dTDP-4-dehydrorhamnose 3,5-epimerase